MAAKKRASEEAHSTRRSKKVKSAVSTDVKQSKARPSSTLLTDDVDFPRGGGTSLTPAEVKAIRAEGIREANEELFKDESSTKKTKKRKRGSVTSKVIATEKKENSRIEHLNYKRLTIGMKILGQIISVHPLTLVVSLPNQLYAHVPITNVSSHYTSMLERIDELRNKSPPDEEGSDSEVESDKDEEPSTGIQYPELSDMFRVGQYIRAVVTTVHAPGTSTVPGLAKSRDELVKASKRVELSLSPDKVNAGIPKSELQTGFTLTAAIKSVEDHGYILDLGIPDVTGFLPFENANQGHFKCKLREGWLLDVTVTKLSKNQRNCDVSVDTSMFSSSYLSGATHANSLLPGELVQCLITATSHYGLNLQVLGLFDGTVDEFHMHKDILEKSYKVGKKVKARILYSYDNSPPKFALALTDHVLRLETRMMKDPTSSESKDMAEMYPVGTTLESVKVTKVEPDRGVVVDVNAGIQGFVHISHLSDDHVPSLNTSGPWKTGSLHRARVIGYFAFDGLLQLSLKPSVLNQTFMQVSDVEVGQVIKGTIKKLSEFGLFVTISGSIDGIIWPNHYADIALKHPAKRFKPGASLKCRVLVVDPDRKRISLTAKKTLVQSTMPVLSRLDDVKIGIVTHAVVFKILPSMLMVEFYSNLKAIVPAKEMSDTKIADPSAAFKVGQIITIRIIGVEVEADQPRIVASIRQASSNFVSPVIDISGIDVGDTVQGDITEIQKENIALKLQPSGARALLSFKNLANYRNVPSAQLRAGLKVGEKLDGLIVVARNPDKNFVIVANKPHTKSVLHTKSSSLKADSVTLGQTIIGRVTQHGHQGTLIKINAHLGGLLHPTDISDDYDSGNAFPQLDSIVKATVIDTNAEKKRLILSTRGSRMQPNTASNIVDREIKSLQDLHVGDVVRGFIKSVAEHGLFVTIGRNIDARIQIKELFNEYIKDWKPRFQANQLVKGRILSVDHENKKVEMTFRSDDFAKRSANVTTGSLQPGQKVDGIIKKVESYGLFIQIDGSKLQGLCHKSEITDSKDADVAAALQGFREGDRVKVFVVKVEPRRISFSIKPSHFVEADFDDGDEAKSDFSQGRGQLGVVQDNGINSDAALVSGEDDLDSDVTDENRSASDDDNEVEIDTGDAQQLLGSVHTQQADRISGSSSVPMKISGFQWFGGPKDGEEEAELSRGESDEDEQPSKKKRKKRKEIEYDLTAEMHSKAPESNADFERVLLGSPNSSYLWIQYMSFQLQLSEIDKAREIARRAISTINFREEQERLNVWIALLNLENVYGTEESLDKTFKEAARANDSKTVYLRLASIFEESEKPEKAEEQYKKTCKKFGQSSKVWTSCGKFYLVRGDLEEARKLLPRSLQSLEKRKHLKTIAKFAQLEYKHGDPERGKTIFEGIVDSHPKRWDLWSVYIDMEAGQRNIQSLRNIFDRVLALKMTSHKAKSFFKKWLELEHRIGDEGGATTVKQKAVEWTQRASRLSS
ncbi:hypothetical protein APHAL10511_006076 [Amanita phalloides]|nr:hypothetical protein APHAL10511_006076 [Amanita phalloides]